MIELNKMAAEIEDIERDITGKNLGSKRYPWDRMADAIKSIAKRAGATLPDKKYSTKKAFIADALEAIADMDFPGISVPNNDVRFIDYDGTVVYSYTAEQFLQITAMPKNPDRTGGKIPLTSLGWNYTLEDAQNYVRKYGMLDVGQMYIPSDDKTHMILDVGPRLTVTMMIQQTVSNGVTIDWGDGFEEETIEGTGAVSATHTYEAEGEYEITLDVADECTLEFGAVNNNIAFNVFGENPNLMHILALKKLFIGNGVTNIYQHAFYGCIALSSLTIPNGITSVGMGAFNTCLALTSLTIPDSIIRIETQAFTTCSALSILSIPNSVTSIESDAFSGCGSLSKIIIPDSMTSIGSSAFWICYTISSVTIPDSVTSVGTYAFASCYALSNLTIPNSVTSIASNAFSSCQSLYTLIILAETPPTLSNINAFYNMPSDCTIYVPYGKGDIYKTDSKWSTWASQIQELPE